VRLLIVVAFALVAGRPALADEIVVRGPELAFSCPNAPTWDGVIACMKRHGWQPSVVRAVGRGKLVVAQGSSDPGVALYVKQANGTWMLGGLFEAGSATYEVLDLQPLTLGHTAGFRFEVGVRQATAISPDSVTTIDGFELMKHVLFCSGSTWQCSDVIPSCDVVLEGRTYSTFHGAVHLVDRELRVEGDGTLASPLCSGPQRQPLAWQ